MDIKLHIKNPEAPKVPERAVWGGSILPVSVLKELMQRANVPLQGTASVPQGMPFRQCALHTPKQAEECLWKPQPVLPFWL